MRGLLEDFFKSLGYRVDCFSSALAALKMLRANKPSSNCILLADIRMIPMNGIELLKIVKKEYPSLPVVLFTSAGGPDERDEVLRQGGSYYFTKPFSLGELHKAIQTSLAAQSFGRSSGSP